MAGPDPRKLLSNAFDKLHEQLSLIRTHVEDMEDPAAEELVDAMEFGLLAPMRKLRLHLDIPYDWHDQKQPTSGSGGSEPRVAEMRG